MSINLLDYRKQIYSSSMGEDGIIEYIFSVISVDNNNKTCVDVGASDGVFISNTRNLIVNHKWSSLQIECDNSKYEELVKNYNNYANVKTLCSYVNASSNLLGNIIEGSGFSKIDFLSIDIDGEDYNVFAGMTKFLPDVLCIEVSAGMSPNEHKVLSLEEATPLSGQSLGAMTDLANLKGYQLIAFNGNAFYIKNELYPRLGIIDNSTEVLYKNFIDIIEQDHKDYFIYWCNRFNIHNSFLGV